MSEHEILVQHMVDIQKATADFREASERQLATSSHTKSVNKHFATRSIVRRRLSIYNWKPGPDGEKKMPSRNKSRAGGTCRYLEEASEAVRVALRRTTIFWLSIWDIHRFWFCTLPPFHASCVVSDRIFGRRLGALDLCYILVPSMYPPGSF